MGTTGPMMDNESWLLVVPNTPLTAINNHSQPLRFFQRSGVSSTTLLARCLLRVWSRESLPVAVHDAETAPAVLVQIEPQTGQQTATAVLAGWGEKGPTQARRSPSR